MELFLQRTGTTAIHVPYKGSAPMLTDLLSGQVVASMDTAATSWPHVQSGKLRALGVSTAQRAFFAPDLTPIADTLPGFDVKPSWQGVMASSGAPQPTVDRLAQEIQAFIAQPAIQAKLRDRGMVPAGSSARIRSGEERRIRAQQEGGEGRRHQAGVRLRTDRVPSRGVTPQPGQAEMHAVLSAVQQAGEQGQAARPGLGPLPVSSRAPPAPAPCGGPPDPGPPAARPGRPDGTARTGAAASVRCAGRPPS